MNQPPKNLPLWSEWLPILLPNLRLKHFSQWFARIPKLQQIGVSTSTYFFACLSGKNMKSRIVQNVNRTECRKLPPCFEFLLIFFLFCTSNEKSCVKTAWKIKRKSSSNTPPKLLACRGYFPKLYTKLAVFESSIALAGMNVTAWSISGKLGTLIHPAHA